MATKVKNADTAKLGDFFGKLYSFNNSLKLYHWHVSGPGSYAQHMALDQAIDGYGETLDSIVETSYALYGDIDIVIPQTASPKNIVKHVSDFYDYVESVRDVMKETFSESLVDDWQENTQQLLYRLKRLQ